MALETIKMDSLPEGRAVGKMSVTIAGNGQTVLSKKVVEALPEDIAICVPKFDKESRLVELTCIKALPKKAEGTANFELRQAKDAATRYFGGTRLWKYLGYDYLASGTQSFPAEVNGSKVSFTLPEGALTPKPKRARKPKEEATAKEEPVEATKEDEDDLTLD